MKPLNWVRFLVGQWRIMKITNVISCARMDPEAKAKWLAQLRAPDAKQARGSLRTEDGMCCLGHLCQVIAPESWGVNQRGEVGFAYEHLGRLGFPDAFFLREINLADEASEFLVRCNDNTRNTLPEIADWIEENL